MADLQQDLAAVVEALEPRPRPGPLAGAISFNSDDHILRSCACFIATHHAATAEALADKAREGE